MAISSPPPSTSMRGPVPAPPEALLALAPHRLPNHRATRYLGDGLFVSMDALAAADQERMRQVYEDLGDLLHRLIAIETDDAGKRRDVQAWMAQGRLAALVRRLHELGQAGATSRAKDAALARTLHDVRGGAVTGLVGRLEMLDQWPGPLSEKLRMIFCLTRDHLKIMRNALVGLDDARRQADLTRKSHSVALLVEKWHEVLVGPTAGENAVRMRVDCRYDGSVSECCLESAAIDRMFYNLANNARRHTADGAMEMAIFELAEAASSCLRFVLSNAVSPAHALALRRLVADQAGTNGTRNVGAAREPAEPPSPAFLRLDPLFVPSVSTTGSGVGLPVVAEFTAHAFGLKNANQAVQEGYVGARLDDSQTFRVWFHWPAARRGLAPKLDDYRLPAESLSETQPPDRPDDDRSKRSGETAR